MRYFLSFLVVLGLLILVVVLLFHDGGGKEPAPQKLTPRALVGYANSDAEAVMTIDGPVNSAQEHQQIRITVSRDNVTYERLKGYSGDAVNIRNFSSDQNAYAAFLYSLARAGFTKGDDSPEAAEERGFCPLGSRYVFEFRQNSQDLERYWTTSCGGPKTYQGDFNVTTELFTLQVPGYDILTRNFTTSL